MIQDPAAPSDKPREPDAQEIAFVKRWLERIKRAKKLPEWTDHCKAVKEGRAAVFGKRAYRDEFNEATAKGPKTNLLFAKIASAEQRVYAKNPQIVVTPEEEVDALDQEKPEPDQAMEAMGLPDIEGAQHEAEEAADEAEKKMLGQFCKTAEVLLSRAFVKEGMLKQRAKTAVRRAFTSRVSWAKITYSKDKRQDPIVVNQLKDAQDNIQRLEAQLKRLRNPDRIADVEAEQAQLRQLMASLDAQSEVVVNEGIVIDILEPTAVLVLKENRQDFYDYLNAPAIVHQELHTHQEMEEQFGLCKDDIEKLTKYRRDGGTVTDTEQEALYYVYEAWSQEDQTVYTMAEGLDRWLREPWTPQTQGQRWFPFFGLAFYLVDGSAYPMSAPELLTELQNDYISLRDMQEEHRKESMPAYFAAGANLDEADIQAVVDRKANQVSVLKNWQPGTPFDQIIARFNPVPMNPTVYDTGPIRADMELVFGVSDAASGGVVDPKTATEASIVEAQFGERVNSFVDTVEDWIGEMAHYALEVLLLELDEGKVKMICGKHAVWPQLSRDDIYERVRAQVLAGSTSKPNKRMERETWMAFLPQLMSMMQAFAQLSAQGQTTAANAVKEVAKETARRFDERINIDRFFPDLPKPQAAPMLPGMPTDPTSAEPMQPGADMPAPGGMLTAAAAQSADMMPSPAQVQ